MKQVHSCGVVVYRIDQGRIEYLVLKYAAGHWDFPKGKMETGETMHDTALRELHEEAGISALLEDNFERSFSYEFVDYDGAIANKTVHFFIGKTDNAAISLSDEHTDFAWLYYGAAYERLTYDNARLLLADAQQFLVQRLGVR